MEFAAQRENQEWVTLVQPLSLHRVVNGADAARFIVKLSQSLADSMQLLVDA